MTRGIYKVAVLGGSRFIGHAIVEALLKQGCNLTTVNRGVTPVHYSGPVERIVADRGNPADYARALANLDADCVVDVTAYRADETGIVLDAFRGRLDRFIHISTLSVYRWPFSCSVSEDAPLETNPTHAYGFQKAECERLIFSESAAALPWTVLRLPAVFGPRDPFSREAYLYGKILKGETIVVPRRSYQCQNIFIADVARVVCDLIENPKASGRVYNAGGASFTLEEYVYQLAEFARRQPRMMRAEGRVLEQSGADLQKIPYFFEGDLVLDTGRIRDEIGFAPSSNMKESLSATIDGISGVPKQEKPGWWSLPWDGARAAFQEETLLGKERTSP